VDLPVLLFSLALAVFTSIIFGLTPALHLVRRRGSTALRSGQREGNPGGHRVRGFLMATQIAITVALLVGTGLLGSTFQRMQQNDTGLPVETGISVPLSLDRYSFDRRRVIARAIRTNLEAIPSVSSAGSSNVTPFSGGNTSVSIAVEGRANTPENVPYVRWRAVGEGYFHALNARPVAGRLLEAADFRDAAEPVVVLGENLARRLAGTPRSAVGRRIAMGWNGTNWNRVVGVVQDVEDVAVTNNLPLTFFFPGEGGMSQLAFLVQLSDGGSSPPAAAIRQAVWDVDPTLPVPTIEPLDQSLGRVVDAPRFNVIVVGVFAGVALVISVMGVYGVTLFSVSQRSREIGVRIALGARPRRVVGMVLRHGLLLSALGILGGLVLAMALSRTIESLLYQTSPLDGAVLVAACLVTATASAMATWLPARRAGHTDPVQVLRTE
jgi:predicted permease